VNPIEGKKMVQNHVQVEVQDQVVGSLVFGQASGFRADPLIPEFGIILWACCQGRVPGIRSEVPGL